MSAVVLVATPLVAVVVMISPAVAVSVGHAAGEDVGYLHAVSSLVGWDGLLRPMGGIALGYRKVSSGCR